MSRTAPFNLLLVAPDRSENSIGRAYCLWLLARELRWSCHVVTAAGEVVWEPLRGTRFAEDVQLLPRPGRARREALRLRLAGADAVIAVKPRPDSLGLVRAPARRMHKTLIVDIDDPDIEVALDGLTPAVTLKKMCSPRLTHWKFRLLRRHVRGLPTLVSNPSLQRTHGGTLIPHAREVPDPPRAGHRRHGFVVAFVGTTRRHKGIHVLREAVSRVSHLGVTLVITAAPPADARAWESWLGETSFESGMALVRDADVVAVPSIDTVFSRGQLPAKVVDAMMYGRAVVASDLPPLRWALGDSGLLCEAGSVEALADGLAALADADLRARLGARAHDRAQRLFAPDVLAARFRAAVLDATQVPDAVERAAPAVDAVRNSAEGGRP